MRVLASVNRWLLAGVAGICGLFLAIGPINAPAASSASAMTNVGPLTEAAPPDLRIDDIQFRVEMQPFPDTYVGMTHFTTHTVQIDPSSQSDERRRVYLHEMMHVAWHKGAASPDKGHKYTEEEAIQALTPGLLKMLAENPQAVQYLRQASK